MPHHSPLGEPLLILALKNVTIVGDRMAFSGWSGGLMIIDLASQDHFIHVISPLDVFPRIGGVKSQIRRKWGEGWTVNSEKTGTFAGKNKGHSSRGTSQVPQLTWLLTQEGRGTWLQRNPPGESLRFTDFWGREDGIKQKYHESSMNDVNFKTKMTTFVKSEWIARMTKYNPYDQCACAGRILIATSYFRECGSRSGEAVRRPGKEGEGPEYGEGLL